MIRANRTDVSILIVCWNSASSIERCLASLDPAKQLSALEIIVVDNGSTDETVSIVQSNFPHVNLIEAGANLGFARATNLAACDAGGRLLFLLNPDAEVLPGALDRLVQFMDEHPSAGAVSPKLLDEDGIPALFAIREFPSLANAISRQFGLRKLFPRHRYFGKETLPACDRSQVSVVPCVTGAALMVPHVLFRHLGGLDETLPMYFEDLDLCARIGKQMPIYHFPTAEVVHIGGKSADGSSARPLLLAMENGEAPWMYLRRYGGLWQAHAFTGITFVSNAFRLVVLGMLIPVALLLGRGPVVWTKLRIRRSLSLIEWCLISRRRFYSRIASVFDIGKAGAAHISVIQNSHPPNPAVEGFE